ncbi:MAG: RIP metalloprotease RseP [Ignavibacteriales bacterium]|nr:RIP metalloprotease RseP [Ignavibacteriales bacterium]
MAIINSVLFFIIAIGILVLIHELGHFLAAKLSGMRVDRFSLGFPPRAFGFQWGSKRLQQKFLRDIRNTLMSHITFHSIHNKLSEEKITSTHEETLNFLTQVFSIEENEQKIRTVDGEQSRNQVRLLMNEEHFPEHIREEFRDSIFQTFSADQNLVDDFRELLDIQDVKKFKQHYATDYCLSWLPIGGFVKINGMIDESFDTDFLQHTPKPWEFRARPMWQRMFVITAGVIMNLLLAIGIFWWVNFSQGKTVYETTQIIVQPKSAAAKSGLNRGDKILTINNSPVSNWNEIFETMQLTLVNTPEHQQIEFTVERSGTQTTIPIDRKNLSEGFGIFPMGIFPKVRLVDAGKPAEQIGLLSNDIITKINSDEVDFFSLSEIVHSNAGKTIQIEWKRNGKFYSSNVTVLPEGRIGITLDTANSVPTKRLEYGLLEALPVGIAYGIKICEISYTNLWQIATGNVSFKQSLAGPVRIAQMSAQAAESGIEPFLTFIALLSISLAIINIFPFPALDGGHLMFLIYEAIFRREIPVKVKLVIQQAGFYMLLMLMAFILYNDIANL